MTKQEWLEVVMDALVPEHNPEHPDLPRVREGLSKLNRRELAALENLLAGLMQSHDSMRSGPVKLAESDPDEERP
jgi:hypothetical protein